MSILFDYDPEAATIDGNADVPSPCIGICKMDNIAGWCEGCYRTIEEITHWSKADNAYKRIVWHQIKHRMFQE
ncbi:DUF1289 domain-containing protein [Undibacterium terreum]|uniref:Fe-S protein n=1 Tax=Undibacterium terreum TaxID=1224302 RepID=A0A916UV72_9BURK|nr:DUF1289 domain-containing protein [Undibacterium terreum]GGC86653.1 hypothetical protein GCM10011396_37450 [Undibacterium terreum]